MNNVDMAYQDFLQVANLDPNDEENRASLSKILYDAGKFDELIKCKTSWLLTASYVEVQQNSFCDTIMILKLHYCP